MHFYETLIGYWLKRIEQPDTTKEELDEYGWEQCQLNLSNPAVTRKLDTDPELNKLLLKKIAHEEIVTYCENVLKSLNNRSWDLGNFIKYRQLVSGN